MASNAMSSNALPLYSFLAEALGCLGVLGFVLCPFVTFFGFSMSGCKSSIGATNVLRTWSSDSDEGWSVWSNDRIRCIFSCRTKNKSLSNGSKSDTSALFLLRHGWSAIFCATGSISGTKYPHAACRRSRKRVLSAESSSLVSCGRNLSATLCHSVKTGCRPSKNGCVSALNDTFEADILRIWSIKESVRWKSKSALNSCISYSLRAVGRHLLLFIFFSYSLIGIIFSELYIHAY